MRPAFALLFATTTWALTCGTPPPCSALTPDLTVLLAEAMETHLPVQDSGKLHPVRMKLRTLLYGRSPGAEFVWYAWPSAKIHPGDVFYLEENAQSNFRAQLCGVSGGYYEPEHGERVKFFRELAAGEHTQATLRVHASDHNSARIPGVSMLLANAARRLDSTTNTRGEAAWDAIPPGRYALTISKQHFSIKEAPGAIEVVPGACLQRFAYLRANFSLTGTIQTPDGKHVGNLPVQLVRETGATDSATETDENGRFTFPHVNPGEYTLVAGTGTPYPATYYPGVPNRELARTIAVGPDADTRPLQLWIPHPRPTRTLSLRIPNATAAYRIRPNIAVVKGTLYEQKWNQADRIITAVITATEPFTFRLGALPEKTSFEISEEITIPAGNESLTLPVPLQAPR
jgi:hypothetical protein